MKAVGRLKTRIFERVNCLGRCSVLVRAGLLPQRRMQESLRNSKRRVAAGVATVAMCPGYVPEFH
jgi:hypothetical protein